MLSPEQTTNVTNGKNVIDCTTPQWKSLLKQAIQDGLEVDLVHFDYTENGEFCETLAMAHKMNLRIDFKESKGFFRQRS